MSNTTFQAVCREVAEKYGYNHSNDPFQKMIIMTDSKVLEQAAELYAERRVEEAMKEVRSAFADYYRSEGCSCCRNIELHEAAEKRLAELLKPEQYEDGSGSNWFVHSTKPTQP